MRKSDNVRDAAAKDWVVLIGGCHGTHLFRDPDDKDGRSRRQFLLANCAILTMCIAIVALVFAVAIVAGRDGS